LLTFKPMKVKELIHIKLKLICALLMSCAIFACTIQQLEMTHDIKAIVNEVKETADGSVKLSISITECKKMMGMVVKDYKDNPLPSTIFITTERVTVPKAGDRIEAKITAISHIVIQLKIM